MPDITSTVKTPIHLNMLFVMEHNLFDEGLLSSLFLQQRLFATLNINTLKPQSFMECTHEMEFDLWESQLFGQSR
jgi:hypothetical protein